MPRVKLMRPEADALRGMVLDKQYSYRKTNDDMAAALGCSRATWQRMLRNGSRTWTVDQVRKICRYLDIPIEQAREAI